MELNELPWAKLIHYSLLQILLVSVKLCPRASAEHVQLLLLRSMSNYFEQLSTSYHLRGRQDLYGSFIVQS